MICRYCQAPVPGSSYPLCGDPVCAARDAADSVDPEPELEPEGVAEPDGWSGDPTDRWFPLLDGSREP